MSEDIRANALLVTILLVGTAVVVASGIGYVALQSGPAEDAAGAAQTPTPEPRTIDVVAEQWDDQLFLVVQSGGDLASVTAFSVSGASLNGTLDPSADHPKVRGTVDLPARVTVTATFEDGSSQVVAEWEFE